MFKLPRNKPNRSNKTGLLLATAALSAAATAIWVEAKARRAEREHPPAGRFLDVDGVRLHYVERGAGSPVVLLHGNMVTLEDFEASGLLDALVAAGHRVIAFDRPGFGHSSRPRDRLWTPAAQAQLLGRALRQLGVEHALVAGHSMGAMVAMALALDDPSRVRSLVVLGGYYYPSARIDALLIAPVALPVIGDVLRYTASALTARALLGKMVKAMFAPREVPPAFGSALSREMMLRPVQLRADAEDGTFMVPAAVSMDSRYGELAELPVLLVAGARDLIIDAETQTERLHQELPRSTLVVVPDAGHMVHYDARVGALVVEAAGAMRPPLRAAA